MFRYSLSAFRTASSALMCSVMSRTTTTARVCLPPPLQAGPPLTLTTRLSPVPFFTAIILQDQNVSPRRAFDIGPCPHNTGVPSSSDQSRAPATASRFCLAASASVTPIIEAHCLLANFLIPSALLL